MRLAHHAHYVLSHARFLAEIARYNGAFTPESAVKHMFNWNSVSLWQAMSTVPTVGGELLLPEIERRQALLCNGPVETGEAKRKFRLR
jgi:hypothetical protein